MYIPKNNLKHIAHNVNISYNKITSILIQFSAKLRYDIKVKTDKVQCKKKNSKLNKNITKNIHIIWAKHKKNSRKQSSTNKHDSSFKKLPQLRIFKTC